MIQLAAGDVLSYSSGSSQSGPLGFRRLREGRKMLEPCAARWPHLLDALGREAPLVINAYPASLGRFAFGIAVDSYLNPKTVSRSLQLAALENRTAVLIAQPLFIGELVERHWRAGFAMPTQIIFATGGYPLPQSLERFVRTRCLARGTRAHFVHFYGVAEVDAACLAATERDTEGRLLYFPMGADIEPEIRSGQLLLSLRQGNERVIDRFETGDAFEAHEGSFRLLQSNGAEPSALSRLEAFAARDWARRTGYFALSEAGLLVDQLRPGVEPGRPGELRFHDYCAKIESSWLDKPRWPRVPPA